MNSSVGCKQFYSHSSPNTLCVVLCCMQNQIKMTNCSSFGAESTVDWAYKSKHVHSLCMVNSVQCIKSFKNSSLFPVDVVALPVSTYAILRNHWVSWLAVYTMYICHNVIFSFMRLFASIIASQMYFVECDARREREREREKIWRQHIHS